MGFYKMLVFLVGLTVLLTPLVSLREKNGAPGEKLTEEIQTKNASYEDETKKGSPTPETVKVFLKKENKVIETALSEYLLGVLAAEMPATYHEEALKAQAVAAYTYLTYKRNQGNADGSIKGADLSDDSSTHQGYLTAEKRSEKWGDKTAAYEKKLTEAIESVSGKLILFEGEPIIAAFHAVNSGVTQSAKTVWGGEVPYLKSVTSTGDKLSPDCSKTVAVKAQELSEKLSSLDGCELSGEAESWIGKVKANSSGYVTSAEICGESYSGLQVREAVGLRSAVFTYEYKNSTFYFTTLGYGHCVGLSQYGADYMARQGSTYDEILKHYYSGVEIEEG